MPATLIAGPALEPVSLEEVKAHLRVDHDDEDGLLTAAIVAARSHVESATRRVLVTQTWRGHLDRWPRQRLIRLPVAPLISVDEIRVRTGDGTTVVDADDYAVDTASVPGRLFLSGDVPSPTIRGPGAIEIDLTAGYGTLASSVPSPLRHAIRMLVAHWYEQRGAVADGRIGATVPLGFAALVAPYRIFLP